MTPIDPCALLFPPCYDIISANTWEAGFPKGWGKVMTIEEERALLAAAAAGDAEAMARLFEAYRGLLVRAAHLSKVRTVAEDAMGVAAVEFLQAVRSYDAARGVNFAAYAKSAVYAGVHQFFRRELRHWQHEFVPFDGDEDAPSVWDLVADERDAMGIWELSEDVQRAFALLSERERQAVGLTFLLGLTQKRAAEILSVRPQTLNDARKRAVRKLREYFDAEGYGCRRCLA